MASVRFAKWEGTGNDFILIDDRTGAAGGLAIPTIVRLCDRHFGIGSDGLILIRPPRQGGTAFHMDFANPDGSRSFCGNGSRCAYAFWRSLQADAFAGEVRFTAIDGEHAAAMEPDGLVCIAMRTPSPMEPVADGIDLVHTGSPHLLVWVDDPEAVDLVRSAHVHRYSERFRAEGVNVNFLTWKGDHVQMRTYERGVEAETLSCGTGVTAAAIGAWHKGMAGTGEVVVRTRGGELRVRMHDEVPQLIGPARRVFTGEVEY